MVRISTHHLLAGVVFIIGSFQVAVKAQPVGAPPPPAVALPGDPIGAPGVVPAPRKETPEKQIEIDLEAFASAINSEWTFNIFPYIDGARYGFYGATEWHRWWLKNFNSKLTVRKIIYDKLEADSATVTVEYTCETPKRGSTTAETAKAEAVVAKETLHLRRRPINDPVHPEWAAGLWSIVVTSPEKVQRAPWNSLERLALCFQQPADFNPVSDVALSQLKQLALGVFQFRQDYGQYYAFGPGFVEEAIRPYVRDAELFKIPMSQANYAFNTRLCALYSAKVEFPNLTPLFYDGQNEQLNYRYNGKAAVAFADGHAALVTAEDAKNLKWQP